MNTMTRLLIAAATVATLAACTKKEIQKPDVEETRPTTTQASEQNADGRYTPEDLDRDPCLVKRVVYFDFDMADIKSEFASVLACHAKYLTDRPSARITLEGHADERGSREYNLGLGERRGNAVNGAVLSNGGSASQLTVVSYGEERPTCTDSTEGCWGQNRRVEIVYTAR